MDVRQFVILAAQLSILCIVFGFGLKATIDDLLYLIHRPGLLARSLLAMFVVMPVVAVVLVWLFDFRPTVEIALVALAFSPVPPVLPQRGIGAGGHSPYAIGLLATFALLAVVLSPLAVQLLGWVFGRSLAVAPGAVARLALLTVLAPLAAGVIAHAIAPRAAASMVKPIGLTGNVLLLLAVLGLFVAAAPAIWGLVGDGTVMAMILFQTVAFATGHLLGGPDVHHSIVLALATACRHPAIALTIAAANFPEQRFGGAILLYAIVGAIAATPYLAWQRRRIQAPATEVSAPVR